MLILKHFFFVTEFILYIKHTIKILLLLLVFSFHANNISASHLVGGNITYTYSGNNVYQITLTLWRDCNSNTQFDNCAYLYVYPTNTYNSASPGAPYLTLTTGSPTGGTTGSTVAANNYSPCLTPPTNICVSQAIYKTSATLPPIAGGYTIVYQRCCRNASITNINTPSTTGATFTCEVPDSVNYINSSPVFNSFPPIFICQNFQFTYNAAATDADADSLAYSLFTPNGSPQNGISTCGGGGGGGSSQAVGYSSVAWKSPYSQVNMLGGTTPLTIDPKTGIINAFPPTAGQFVVGIAVSEYRNGVYLNTLFREFQFNVTACKTVVTSNVQTNITAGAVKYILACDSNKVQFTNTSTPINNLSTFFWNFGDVRIFNDTSSLQNPLYNYADSGTYTAMLIMNPTAGGTCVDTAFVTVKVYPPFVGGYYYQPQSICLNSVVQFTDTSKGLLMPNQWVWNFGDGDTSHRQHPKHIYTTAGTFNATLTVNNKVGCSKIISKSIIIQPHPLAVIATSSVVCDSIVQFISGAAATSFYWHFGDTSKTVDSASLSQSPTHGYPTPGNYTVTLIVYPNSSCADTTYKSIEVRYGLNANFLTNNVCVYDTAVFKNITYHSYDTLVNMVWHFGDNSLPDTTFQSIVKHKYDTAGVYNVSLITQTNWGCIDTFTKQIIIYDYPQINAGPDTLMCYLDTIKLRAYDGIKYQWYPQYDIINPDSANALITTQLDTTYYVTVTTQYGCTATDSIKINTIKKSSLTYGTSKDTTICIYDSIQINANGGIWYKWLQVAGISDYTTDAPWVKPLNSTFYIVYIRTANCAAFDTVTIKVKPLANADAGPNKLICKNEVITLQGSGGQIYSWQPLTNLVGNNMAHPVVNPKITTTYYVTVIDTFVCLQPIVDSVIITVDQYDGAYAGNDTNVVKGIPFTLSGSGGVYYEWQLSNGILNGNTPNPTIILERDTTIILKTKDEFECISYDTLIAYVHKKPIVIMPNAFSPNGDGIDDLLLPIYSGSLLLHHFNIYNRWGQSVFSTLDNNKGWDGLFNEKPQEVGVYMYFIDGVDVSGNYYIYKGDVTLLR